MADAVFRVEGGRFVPEAPARSPWGDELLHGGPPAGLLARAIEQHAGEPAMLVSRLTVDLLRPVPSVPLEAVARTVRAGRRLHVVEASLLADGVEVSRATALLLREAAEPVSEGAGALPAPPGPDGLETGPLGRGERGPDGAPYREGFHTTVEARWASRPREFPPMAWIRVPLPLVAGEELTPLVRVAATADFVNAVGSTAWGGGLGYINADLTVYLHRLPVGEWIGLQVERTVEPSGLGVSRATLFDARGMIGTAAQAVLANRMT